MWFLCRIEWSELTLVCAWLQKGTEICLEGRPRAFGERRIRRNEGLSIPWNDCQFRDDSVQSRVLFWICPELRILCVHRLNCLSFVTIAAVSFPESSQKTTSVMALTLGASPVTCVVGRNRFPNNTQLIHTYQIGTRVPTIKLKLFRFQTMARFLIQRL
jgi:hypothetical protein